jgi:hypothetical protein
MGASTIPLSEKVIEPEGYVESRQETRLKGAQINPDWMRIGVSCTLMTGSLLLLTGKRKAGLIATFAGTALAILEHQDLVSEWWNTLPRYLNDAQRMLDQAAITVEDLTAKGEQIKSLFTK